MAIQALSSVTNKGYSNISFGKRSGKTGKNHNVSSPMKAVPLAVLIAMSPLNTTKAADIMREENGANRIELAEAPQSTGRVALYGNAFKTQNGSNVTVMALNTKGGTDSYDQILLKVGDYTFEAKDLIDRVAYLYSSNGVKEGPLRFTEVVAETELDGKKTRFSFLDSNVVGFVEAVVAQPTNQSNIKNKRTANLNLLIAGNKGQLIAVSDEQLQNFLRNVVGNFKIPAGQDGRTLDVIYSGLENVKRLDDWSERVQGSHGDYSLRFYDVDGNPNDAEEIFVQKDNEKDWGIKKVIFVDGELHGVDAAISTGTLAVIQPWMMTKGEFFITDDELANRILEIYSSPRYNKTQEDAITIEKGVSKLALGDY